ncbi:hypothetical protein PENTCL1PPCAC_23733, partial [Pristionchus entomophagus]
FVSFSQPSSTSTRERKGLCALRISTSSTSLPATATGKLCTRVPLDAGRTASGRRMTSRTSKSPSRPTRLCCASARRSVRISTEYFWKSSNIVTTTEAPFLAAFRLNGSLWPLYLFGAGIFLVVVAVIVGGIVCIVVTKKKKAAKKKAMESVSVTFKAPPKHGKRKKDGRSGKCPSSTASLTLTAPRTRSLVLLRSLLPLV